MNTPEDRERMSKLQELENEIYQEQHARKPEVPAAEIPLYQTKKHQPAENSLKKLSRKIIKYAKFTGFVVGGIAMIKVGFFIGMWLTYLIMAGIIAGIGYQIFLKDD